MALKATVAKIDEVDEKYRDLYTQQGDKWVLTGIEGIKTQADIDKLTKALQGERAQHGETAKKLKEAEEKAGQFGEMTPEKIQEMTEKLETLQAAGTPELAKNFEKIVTDRVEALKVTAVKQATDKLNKDLAAAQKALDESTKRVADFEVKDQHRTIDDAVRSAADAAKILPGAQTDALIRARNSFKIVEGKVVTEDGMTPADWLEARKQDAAHWWPVARGTGAHGSDGNGNFNSADNPWTAKNWNMTKQSEMVRTDAVKAARLAEQAGSKIGATAPTKEDK